MKNKLLVTILSTVISVLFLAGIARATFQGFQGGTGFSTTTVGNVGNFLSVASTSPFLTYAFTSGGGGGSTTTINGLVGPSFTFTGTNITITSSSGPATINFSIPANFWQLISGTISPTSTNYLLGLGTNSARSLLDIQSSSTGPLTIIGSQSPSTSTPFIYSLKLGTSFGDLGTFGFNNYVNSAGTIGSRINTNTNGWAFTLDNRNSADNDLHLDRVTSAGTNTTLFDFGATGKLGIGTTTPSSTLTIIGGAQISGLANTSSSCVIADSNGVLSIGTSTSCGAVSSVNGSSFIGVSPTTGAVTITNNGVQQNTAGSNIILSNATGTVNIAVTSTPSFTTVNTNNLNVSSSATFNNTVNFVSSTVVFSTSSNVTFNSTTTVNNNFVLNGTTTVNGTITGNGSGGGKRIFATSSNSVLVSTSTDTIMYQATTTAGDLGTLNGYNIFFIGSIGSCNNTNTATVTFKYGGTTINQTSFTANTQTTSWNLTLTAQIFADSSTTQQFSIGHLFGTSGGESPDTDSSFSPTINVNSAVAQGIVVSAQQGASSACTIQGNSFSVVKISS